MLENAEGRFEAWLDEENRIVSFHEIPDSRYCSAEEHDFWQMIVNVAITLSDILKVLIGYMIHFFAKQFQLFWQFSRITTLLNVPLLAFTSPVNEPAAAYSLLVRIVPSA